MSEIQRIQTEYRRKLANHWKIPPGSRVLEIGCGQGDMTAVLAESVGPTGHVTAVDIANPSYGSPQTLGEATDMIKALPIGDRIDFRFNFDILKENPGQFDVVVMAHCSWYFSSVAELTTTLSRLKNFGQRFCFAEWDLAPQSMDQLPHYMAIHIQRVVEAFKESSESNVRTPVHRKQLREILSDVGWKVIEDETMDSTNLQDADWEIGAVSSSSLREAKELGLPDALLSYLESSIEELRRLSKPKGNTSLHSYSISAERA